MFQQFMPFIYYCCDKMNWICDIKSSNYFIINQIAVAVIKQLIEVNVWYSCYNEASGKYKCTVWLLW